MRRTLVIAAMALLTTMGMAQTKTKPKPLSDAALDRVTAAGVTAGLSNGAIQFQGEVPTKNGLVTGAGTLAILNGPVNGITTGTLSLNGNSQQNLTSLVNINAVNSTISVLLNLNVNINSSVGTLTQTNLSNKH
ncbi:hypothetical protein [Edaphobacter bradus]|uniref:hypothetical protein n=1 Tax=Edaphobacter bradus TaxID=2259016 RepID=UPI0021DFFEFE|nr:hypothetical protein [Edaphobacter bradus]